MKGFSRVQSGAAPLETRGRFFRAIALGPESESSGSPSAPVAIVIAKAYRLDRARSEYSIKLEYVFYDVFGLDDDDLREYGADGGWFDSDAAQGITAWWQLQHQQGYVPLITRIAFEKDFTVPIPPWGPRR